MYSQYPLTPNQRTMALSSIIHSGSGIYIQQQTFHLNGDVDAVQLREAWEVMTKRHQVLRSSVHLNTEEGSVLRVWATCEVDFREVMQTTVPKKDQDNVLRRILKEDQQNEFDLSTPPLARIRLVKTQKTSCILLISTHHSILDGASRQMLLSELFQVYLALNTGDPISLPDRPAYSEFGEWIKTIDKSAHHRFWSTQAALKQAVGDLPGDIQEDKSGTARDVTCKIIRRVVPEAEFGEMKVQLDRHDVSLPVFLISAWCVLLGRYIDTDKVVFGLTRTGRREPDKDFSKVIGALVGTIPVAVDLTDTNHYEALYKNVQSLIKKTRECEHTDLTELRQILGIPSEKPLFGTNLVINRNPFDLVLDDSDNSLQIEKSEITGYPDIPIFLQIYTEPSLRIDLYYDIGRYSANYAQRILQHYINIISQMCEGENSDWRRIQFFDSREQNKIITQWNATRMPYQQDKTVGQLFQIQAAATPDSIAVECEDGNLTFSQLSYKANRLANYLQELGVSPEVPVAVYCRRSLDLVVAALGVIKAGGAIVPLDPDYPEDRVKFMLRDSGASICLSSISLKQKLKGASCNVIYLDSEEQHYDTYCAETQQETASADSMAYIIYTSGSTGTPKGVVGLHRGIINRCSWMWQTYPFGENEICCLIAKISFVDSIWGMFGPLLQGIRLVVIPEEVVQDPVQLIQQLAAKRITRLVLVPSLLRAILASTKNIAGLLPDLKLWITSGESLSEELYAKFRSALPDCTLLNLYGSTEVSADVTACELTRISRPTRITIGRPISNTQIYILDRNCNPVPVGVPGELHVGGDGLARGYFNRPDLTSERFILNPFIKGTNYLFKTGDVARYWEDGEIEFLGRLDSQVKLRGFRIEPGEIENVICEVEGVDSAVVVLKGKNSDQQYLAAFYQASGTIDIDPTYIRDVTRRKLPGYMVPLTFTELEELPLIPSGKVDRVTLSNKTPDNHIIEVPQKNQSASSLERNKTETMQRMVEVWQEVLGVKNIDPQVNFFDLGGHSLLAVELILTVEDVFGIRLPIQSIFEGPTLLEFLEQLSSRRTDITYFTLSPIDPVCSTPPLFLINGLFLYRELARQLGPNQPTYGIYVEDEVNSNRGQSEIQNTIPFPNVESLAERYMEEIRTIQPVGPYQLGGLSFGGLVAFEVAQQLIKKGEDVALLALLDTNAPGILNASFGRRLINHLESVFTEGVPYIRKLVSKNSLKHKLKPKGTELHGEYIRSNIYHHYRPQKFQGSIVVFKARENDWTGHKRPSDLGWGVYADGAVKVYEIPGNHLNILEDPNVQILASALTRHLHN